MSKKRIATGVAVAALYVLVAQLSFRSGLVPTRPLYDGTQQVARYRWVNPPPDLVSGNITPSGGVGTMQIGSKHTPAYNVNSGDGQASIIFPPDGVVPMPGQTSVKLEIKPLDPAKVASPPAGFDYDGNAYSFTGAYQPSGKPVEIPNVTCSLTNANACATIVLRYAFNAVKLMRLDGTTWTEVPSQRATSALQIYGNTNKLGTFVAVDPHSNTGHTLGGKSQTGNIIAFTVGLVAILLGTFLARVRATRRRRASDAGKGQKEQKGRPEKPLKPRKEARRRREEQEQKPWWRD